MYHYKYPMFAYTADVVMINEYDHILLIRRLNEPYSGSWALPGGHVEQDETAMMAACRELNEETNIAFPMSQLATLGAYDTVDRDPRGRYITQVFIAEVSGDDYANVEAKDDACDYQWFDANSILGLIDEGQLDVAFDHYEIIKDALELLGV